MSRLAYADALECAAFAKYPELATLESAKIFLLTQPLDTNSVRNIEKFNPSDREFLLDEKRLDLPFENLWIERIGEPLGRSWFVKNQNAEIHILVHGIFVREQKTGACRIDMLVSDSTNGSTGLIPLITDYSFYINSFRHIGNGLVPATEEEFEKTIETLASMAGDAVHQISTNRPFQGTVPVHKVHFRENGKPKVIKIKDVIYIGAKNAKTLTTPSGLTIEYSHRFDVRGHWRTLADNKLGKDRNGAYNQPGRTWVRPFQKGPEDAPYVKKTRVLLPEGATNESAITT